MDYQKKELYTQTKSSGVIVDDISIQAWNDVRNDDTDSNWILLGFVDNTTIVTLKAKGTGNLEELIRNLNQNEIMFGGIRCSVTAKVKFYHIFFVGQNVSAMKKGKSSMYKSGVLQKLEGGHGEVFIEDINSDTITTTISQILKHNSLKDQNDVVI